MNNLHLMNKNKLIPMYKNLSIKIQNGLVRDVVLMRMPPLMTTSHKMKAVLLMTTSHKMKALLLMTTSHKIKAILFTHSSVI